MINIPKEEIVKVSDIKVDGNNPNKMSSDKLNALCENIKEFGFTNPIITDLDLVIADGEHRLRAAKKLKLASVPVFRLDISAKQRLIIRQVQNKLHGTHDETLDIDELQRILADDGLEELNRLMGDDKELKELLEKVESQKERIFHSEEDEVPEKAPERVKLGDLWLLGEHRLLCGDATKQEDLRTLVNAQEINCVITDPPYNTGMKENEKATRLSHMFNDSYTEQEWNDFLTGFTTQIKEQTAENCVYYIFMDWRRNHELTPYLSQIGKISNIIVWDKIVHGLGSDYKYTYELINVIKKGKPKLSTHQDKEYQDIWHVQRKVGRNPDHATAKPIELLEIPIRHATVPQEIILDIFGGSGSTLIAAEKTGRKCYMMELDEHYCNIILARWEAYTGQKAIKE